MFEQMSRAGLAGKMGLALFAVFDMMLRGGFMKKLFLCGLLAALALFGLSACTKDDLSQIDIKTDGSFKSSYSVGSGGSGAYGRMRTGLSF